MLGIGFGEIMIITVIGLIVIGPQRLPETARFLGHLFGRVQRQIAEVKRDIKQEMALEDVKHIHKEYEKAAQDMKNVFDQAAKGMPTTTDDIAQLSSDESAAGDAKDSITTPVEKSTAPAVTKPANDSGKQTAANEPAAPAVKTTAQ